MRLAAFASVAVAACAVLALWGCASSVVPTAPGSQVMVDTRLAAQGQDSRVQFLVLHFTNETLERSLHILTQENVSAHYLVTDESPPRILRLVDEGRRAWHAGISWWRGTRLLNSASIGIEIVYPGLVPAPNGMANGKDYPEYPAAQIDAVVALVQDIVRRHHILPERVVAHADIAPTRRSDPGPKFPWKRLADLGIVAWPDAAAVADERAGFEHALPDIAWFQRQLTGVGFEPHASGVLDEPTRRALVALQMKYRPSRYDGQPDAETAAILAVLNRPRATPP